MTEALDLFPKSTWVTRADHEHKEATELFRAAVMSARSGNDDSIKQVRLIHFMTYFGVLFPLSLPVFVGYPFSGFFPLFFQACLASRPEVLPRFFNSCNLQFNCISLRDFQFTVLT